MTRNKLMSYNVINIPSKNSSKGFTLIELLLALAIFAYSASAILGVVGTASNNLGQIEEMTFASWVANNRLVELQVSTQWPPKDKDKGEQELAGRKWYWQQKVVKTEDKDLRAVTVTVSADEKATSSIYSLTTYVSINAASSKEL